MIMNNSCMIVYEAIYARHLVAPGQVSAMAPDPYFAPPVAFSYVLRLCRGSSIYHRNADGY
jgi:hypothetical protein